jgi:hypothetical protein
MEHGNFFVLPHLPCKASIDVHGIAVLLEGGPTSVFPGEYPSPVQDNSEISKPYLAQYTSACLRQSRLVHLADHDEASGSGKG